MYTSEALLVSVSAASERSGQISDLEHNPADALLSHSQAPPHQTLDYTSQGTPSTQIAPVIFVERSGQIPNPLDRCALTSLVVESLSRSGEVSADLRPGPQPRGCAPLSLPGTPAPFSLSEFAGWVSGSRRLDHIGHCTTVSGTNCCIDLSL